MMNCDGFASVIKIMENFSPVFTAKNSRGKLLPVLIIIVAFLTKATYDFSHNTKSAIETFKKSPFVASCLLLLLIYTVLSFGFKFFFDTGEQLVINIKGIGVLGKPLIEWRSIWYINLKVYKGKGGGTKSLVVKLSENDTEIEVSINDLDKSIDEIMAALKHYSANYDITFLDDGE